MTIDESQQGIPTFLRPLLEQQYGPETAARVMRGYEVRRVVTLRANALKTTPGRVAAELDAAHVAYERVGWYEDAFVLPGACERDVWALPAYEAGEVYLQSLSSMLPPLVLAPRAGADVLDMCAAPGGKTTQMAALTAGRAHICACEMHVPRAEKLEFNLRRQGATNVSVMRTDARRLDDFMQFDQILLDAPCSGSGTLRAADPKLAGRFTPALVQKSVRAQTALLAKALKLLKPGGELVYSTCSVLAAENEDVVRAALARARARLVPVSIPGADDLPLLPTTLPGTLAVCPTERYEGFFVAKIRRVG